MAEGYDTPTPIQTQAIPSVMAGRDLCGIAQTGTGKTAAFALPILHRFSTDGKPRQARGCRALVLSPTRELASQIDASFRTYGKKVDIRTAVVFGGVSAGKQIRDLSRGVDVLVATPGRLLDLIDQRALTLSGVEILVLDEADQMLDLGFIHALRRIIKLLPKARQTLFFSATMPSTISALADDLLDNPVKVAVKPIATTAERVDQGVMFVGTPHKPALLRSVLGDSAMDRVLVFTRTKHGADKVVRQLAAGGIDAAAIHGNKSQPQREKALAQFRAGNTRVLVATDIAARGIHVDEVSHVVNYDLPNIPESYVHRIGRTARAGAGGIALSFCNGEERAYLRDIERLTRSNIPVLPLPAGLAALAEAMPVESTPPKGRPGGGQRQNQRGDSRRQGKSGSGGNRGRSEARPGRGLDEKTGLPGFISRSAVRNEGDRRSR